MKKIILILFVILATQLSFAQSSSNGVILQNVSLNRFSLPKVDNVLKFNIKNENPKTITALHAIWSDGVNEHKAVIQALIPSGESVLLAHPKSVNYSKRTERLINFKVNKVVFNDGTSMILDLCKKFNFSIFKRKTKKSVLFEVSMGTWNGYAPRGVVAIKDMEQKYPESFIGVEVHIGRDPMTNKNYMNGSYFRASPACHVNRVLKHKNIRLSGEESMEVYYKDQIKKESPIHLSGYIMNRGNDNKVRIHTFTRSSANLSSVDYRLGVIVVEDKVTGTSRGYNQWNYYSEGKFGEMGGFENLPNPILAKDMVYNNIGRTLLGGYNGQEGTLPENIKANKRYRYTFEYEVPESQNKDNLSYVVVAIDNNTGAVLNATKVKSFRKLFKPKHDLVSLLDRVVLYPNPTADNLNVVFNLKTLNNVSITIHDASGEVVLTEAYKELKVGRQNLKLALGHLKPGKYFVNISSGKASYTKQVIVK